MNYAKDEIHQSKFEMNKFGIQYFARVPHLDKNVYYSAFVHQLWRIMEIFEPSVSQVAQMLAMIEFGNGPIVFYVVTTKWILDGFLPKKQLCYAYINDAFKMGF